MLEHRGWTSVAFVGPWSEMPIGTRAHSSIGGYWERVPGGWKAQSGSTFPTPGADVSHVSFPSIEGRGLRAAREPGDPVRAEAIELLACLASQEQAPDGRNADTTASLPGGWSRRARREAAEAFVLTPDSYWREVYAEAEARLRETARG